jgi:hypothetical protein
MSYFADLTPHTYTRTTKGRTVLNVGWLDASYPVSTGIVPGDFVQILKRLTEMPMHLHRGVHTCQFCLNHPDAPPATHGNGQIRVAGTDGIWYAAPVLILHYVQVHHYKPPEEFITAVLRSAKAIKAAIAKRQRRESKTGREF